MVAYHIFEVGNFMNLLFSSDSFDLFYMGSINIRTMADYTVDGRRNRDWCKENDSEYVLWSELKSFAYERIKGNKKPSLLKLELLADLGQICRIFPDFEENTAELGECRLKSLRLNFKYESGREKELLTVTTGVSHKEFSMDRSWEEFWDKSAAGFLKGLGLTLEEI